MLCMCLYAAAGSAVTPVPSGFTVANGVVLLYPLLPFITSHMTPTGGGAGGVDAKALHTAFTDSEKLQLHGFSCFFYHISLFFSVSANESGAHFSQLPLN